MALGIENQTVTLLYLGDPEMEGGRRPIANQVTLDVFWNKDLSDVRNSRVASNQNETRISIDQIQAQVIIGLEPDLVEPTPDTVVIKVNGKVYQIATVDPAPSGFGVDGTYIMLVSKTEVVDIT